MLGVVLQTRVSGVYRTHDPLANSLAHYPLDQQGTLDLHVDCGGSHTLWGTHIVPAYSQVTCMHNCSLQYFNQDYDLTCHTAYANSLKSIPNDRLGRSLLHRQTLAYCTLSIMPVTCFASGVHPDVSFWDVLTSRKYHLPYHIPIIHSHCHRIQARDIPFEVKRWELRKNQRLPLTHPPIYSAVLNRIFYLKYELRFCAGKDKQMSTVVSNF